MRLRTGKRRIDRAAVEVLFDDGASLPREFLIWSSGQNTTVNGYDVLFDAQAAEMVMASYEKHGVDVQIDLEHLSLDEHARNYDPDARGWCRLELRDGALWAVDVRWTPDGERRLRERTQRYISPAFLLDEESRPTRVFNIALVARPGTDNLDALIAAHESAGSARGRVNMTKVKKLAEGEGSGEVAGVDIASLAEFLGIAVDPSQDPAGFVQSLLGKLDEVAAKLRGEAPAESAPESEMPAEEMAAAKAVFAILGAKSGTDAIVTASEWRLLNVEHKARLEKLAAEEKALELAKKRQLAARLVACGAETPATAWGDDAKTTPAKHLLSMSVEELESRCSAFEARGNTRQAFAPVEAGKRFGGVELSDFALRMCAEKKIDPTALAAKRAQMRRITAGAQEGDR